MRSESSHQCTTHARHKKGERKWHKVSGFDVIVHKRASPSKKLCKYVQYCLESLWKYHAGVDIFFVLWSLHIRANLQMALLFAGWINCWEIHCAGNYANWSKNLSSLKFLSKRHPFLRIISYLKKKKQKYYELRAMLNMNDTNEAFGALKKKNLRSRTCATEGDITNWSCKDGINLYRYINKVKISVYIQFWHQSWTNPSLEKQPCHPLYS